ncbi:RES family NAD+ phosphorylase [Rhodopila sp.]|uniref:RES family NAD+ phosphorylase n=1 Tax=Rhodopila sp. TaxID=2480087 RepID=UPI003D0F4098
MPPNQRFNEITIPNGVTYETLEPAHMPTWANPSAFESKAFGKAWQRSRRSLLLIVPSFIVSMERNFLINPHHPEFPRLQSSLHRPCWWDTLLFP